MTKQKSLITIRGMHCVACAQTIEKALLKAEGVDKALVNFATETAHVEYDDKITNEKKLTDIIKDTGYDVAEEPHRIMMRVGGMTCASCAQTIENALRKKKGVREASVNLATEKAAVTYSPNEISYKEVRDVVEDVGYQVLGR